MRSIRKILFPVDFSKACEGAGRYVEAFAGRFEAEVKLLHVVNTGTYSYPREAYPHIKDKLERFLLEDLKYIKTSRLCVLGDPAEKIVEVIHTWKPDLVMMPTHGLGAYRRLLIGSVTSKVLHDVSCPVWTDVHSDKAPSLERIQCRKILCAVDLCEQTPAIVQLGAQLAEEYGADLGIVHAIPAPITSAAVRLLDREFTETLRADALAKLTELIPAPETKVFLGAGEPEKVVGCATKSFAADLLLIGRHARGTFLGNRAYKIIRDAPCPVISL